MRKSSRFYHKKIKSFGQLNVTVRNSDILNHNGLVALYDDYFGTLEDFVDLDIEDQKI